MASKSSNNRDVIIEMDDGTELTLNIEDESLYQQIVVDKDQNALKRVMKNIKALSETAPNDVVESGSTSTVLESSSTVPELVSDVLDSSDAVLESESTSNMPTGAVKLLIDLHKKKEKYFIDKKTKKRGLWESIAKEMVEYGYIFSWTQLKNKWGNLLQQYRKAKDNNSKTGRDLKKSPYYEELDDYLGHRPNSRPTFTISSATEPTGLSSDEEDLESSISDTSTSKPTSKEIPVKRKAEVRLSDRQNKVMKQIEDIEKRRREDTDTLFQLIKDQGERQEQQERDKIDILKRILDKF